MGYFVNLVPSVELEHLGCSPGPEICQSYRRQSMILLKFNQSILLSNAFRSVWPCYFLILLKLFLLYNVFILECHVNRTWRFPNLGVPPNHPQWDHFNILLGTPIKNNMTSLFHVYPRLKTATCLSATSWLRLLRTWAWQVKKWFKDVEFSYRQFTPNWGTQKNYH
jgi:hypothetical protein